MYVDSIKRIIKERDKQFREMRKEIKQENKCSWADASDIAGDYIDGMYGNYSGYRKTDISDINKLIVGIKIMHSSFKRSMYDFKNEELELSYSYPVMSITTVYKSKRDNFYVEDNNDSLLDSIKKVKTNILNKTIVEVYTASQYHYGCKFCEWEGIEIYLR